MTGARVETTEALEEVRTALILFQERAQAALGSLRQETRSTLRWLQEDQPRYWQFELRKAYDRVATTRQAYESCRLRTVAGHRSACIEEQVALRKAQRRLEYVQEQIIVTRGVGIQAADQANEFFGQLGPMERMLEDELPVMVAVVERMLAAIEAYANDNPGEEPPPGA